MQFLFPQLSRRLLFAYHVVLVALMSISILFVLIAISTAAGSFSLLISETNAAMSSQLLEASQLLEVLCPERACALEVSKVTARPNQDGTNNVLGGKETRLTWEGVVSEGEEVTSITLNLPEQSSVEDATLKVTVLEGLERLDVESTATISPTDSNTAEPRVEVTFTESLEAGVHVRLELTGFVFPSEGGTFSVAGSYTAYVVYGTTSPAVSNTTSSVTSAHGAAKDTDQTQDQTIQTYELPATGSITVLANTPLQSVIAWLDAQPWVAAWNQNQFLGMFLRPQLLVSSFSSLLPGWILCLGIVILAYPFAILLGLIFAMLKISRHVLLRALAALYINVLRGTPFFLQIYIMFFGLPMLGIRIDNNLLGAIVLAVNSSAYLAEIFRAGIQSIATGQYEAAASIGMSNIQTMLYIILPQTTRRVIPTVTNDFITAFKDTSLLSSVGVMELMMFSKNLTTVNGNITPYVAAGIFYLMVTLPLIKVISGIEKRMERSEKGSGPTPSAAKKTHNKATSVTALQGGHS